MVVLVARNEGHFLITVGSHEREEEEEEEEEKGCESFRHETAK